MKTILLILLVTISLTGYSQKKVMLFNGKNLDGWYIYVSDPAIKPSSFFYVKNGVIETPGVPNWLSSYKKKNSKIIGSMLNGVIPKFLSTAAFSYTP